MNEIKHFISGQSRNKLVITQGNCDLIKPLDIGRLFSSNIKKFKEDIRLPFKAKEVLEEIISESIMEANIFGKVLAIRNLGILFEPELKLDIIQLFDKHSRTNVLFIQWDGEIDNNNLYFLTKDKGQKINIKNLSHIII